MNLTMGRQNWSKVSSDNFLTVLKFSPVHRRMFMLLYKNQLRLIVVWGVYVFLFLFFLLRISDRNLLLIGLAYWLWSCADKNLLLNSFVFFSAVDFRKSLHLRLGLPLDRPLLRTANALNLSTSDVLRSDSIQKGNNSWFKQANILCEAFRKSFSYSVFYWEICSKIVVIISGSTLLQDVHIGIPTSAGRWQLSFLILSFAPVLMSGTFIESCCLYAVSGGTVSLVQGSYEYCHYMQDGFNDSVMEISCFYWLTVY